MSQVIQFLEQLGRDAAQTTDYAARVAALDIEPAARAALIGRDAAELNRVVGGRKQSYCLVAVPRSDGDLVH